MSMHTLFGQFRFRMDTIWVVRWNGLKILIPKHMWKSIIGPLEQILAKNRYGTFFLGAPCILHGKVSCRILYRFFRIFVKKYDDYVLQPPCAWGGKCWRWILLKCQQCIQLPRDSWFNLARRNGPCLGTVDTFLKIIGLDFRIICHALEYIYPLEHVGWCWRLS